MRRLLVRAVSVSFILSVVLVGVLSSSAFAKGSVKSIPQTSSPEACRYNWIVGNGEGISGPTNSGNSDYCTQSGQAGFWYEALYAGNNTMQAWYSYGFNTYIHSCSFYAWFPAGSLSSAHHARYDFWVQVGYNNERWLAWPGGDINQETANVGFYTLGTNVPVNYNNPIMHVSVHDDGDTSGNIAFASIKFVCS